MDPGGQPAFYVMVQLYMFSARPFDSGRITGFPDRPRHHSFAAECDVNKPIEVRGTVTRFDMVNPRTWLYLDAKQPDGTVVSWRFEGGSPSALFTANLGWRKDTIKTGIELVVRGYRAKSGDTVGNGREIRFPDGREAFFGSSGTGTPRSNLDAADSQR